MPVDAINPAFPEPASRNTCPAMPGVVRRASVVLIALLGQLCACSADKGEIVLETGGQGEIRVAGVVMSGSGQGLLIVQLREDFGDVEGLTLSATYSIEQGVGPVLEVGTTDLGAWEDLSWDAEAELAMDAAGRALFLGVDYSECDAATNSEHVRLRSFDHDPVSGWGEPQVIVATTGPCDTRNTPLFLQRDLAMDAAGNALAVWVRRAADDRYYLFAAYRPAGGSWSSPTPVNEPLGLSRAAREPRIAMNRDGRALVAYRAGERNKVSGSLFVHSFDFTSGFGPGVRLDGTDNVYPFALAIDGAGNGLAAWSHTAAPDVAVPVYSSRYLAGTGWTGELAALPAARALARLHAGLDRAGNGWLVYQDAQRIGRAIPFRGDNWLAGQSVALAGNAYRFTLAVAPTGDATVVFGQGEEPVTHFDQRMVYRRFYAAEFDPAVPGSGWQAPVDLEGPGVLTWSGAVLAMEHRDSGLTAWATAPLDDALPDINQIRAYVWAPPLPAFDVTTDRLTVAVDGSPSRARTTNGDIGRFEWDFENDGVVDDTGFRTSHTYSAAGTYAVRLRVTDRDDISAETVQSVTLGGEGPPPPSIYTLSVTTTRGTGEGRVFSNPPGIDCGFGSEDCTEDYTAGTVVMLTHQAGTNARFGGWQGDPDCTDGRVTMDADKGCFAAFDAESGGGTLFALTFLNVRGPGHVETGDGRIYCPGGACSSEYGPGTAVQIRAVPDQGALLEAWESDCAGFGSTTDISVTMDTDVTCSAVFATGPQ